MVTSFSVVPFRRQASGVEGVGTARANVFRGALTELRLDLLCLAGGTPNNRSRVREAVDWSIDARRATADTTTQTAAEPASTTRGMGRARRRRMRYNTFNAIRACLLCVTSLTCEIGRAH